MAEITTNTSLQDFVNSLEKVLRDLEYNAHSAAEGVITDDASIAMHNINIGRLNIIRTINQFIIDSLNNTNIEEE